MFYQGLFYQTSVSLVNLVFEEREIMRKNWVNLPDNFYSDHQDTATQIEDCSR